jgi:hypothetical protein
MEILDSPKFSESILKNLERMDKKPRKDYEKIKKLFPENLCILGGYVRDSILNTINGYNFPINDLDIIAFDNNFKKKISCFPKKSMSRFGGLKLKYSDGKTNFSTDIFSTGNILYLNQNPHLEKNMKNILDGIDLTTSAFAYGICENKIYCHASGLRDISRREINILNDNSIIPSTLSRLIIHTDKLKFKIGEAGKNYIKRNYNPEIDVDIIKFLEYKEVPYLFPLVKEGLESILK